MTSTCSTPTTGTVTAASAAYQGVTTWSTQDWDIIRPLQQVPSNTTEQYPGVAFSYSTQAGISGFSALPDPSTHSAALRYPAGSGQRYLCVQWHNSYMVGSRMGPTTAWQLQQAISANSAPDTQVTARPDLPLAATLAGNPLVAYPSVEYKVKASIAPYVHSPRATGDALQAAWVAASGGNVLSSNDLYGELRTELARPGRYWFDPLPAAEPEPWTVYPIPRSIYSVHRMSVQYGATNTAVLGATKRFTFYGPGVGAGQRVKFVPHSATSAVDCLRSEELVTSAYVDAAGAITRLPAATLVTQGGVAGVVTDAIGSADIVFTHYSPQGRPFKLCYQVSRADSNAAGSGLDDQQHNSIVIKHTGLIYLVVTCCDCSLPQSSGNYLMHRPFKYRSRQSQACRKLWRSAAFPWSWRFLASACPVTYVTTCKNLRNTFHTHICCCGCAGPCEVCPIAAGLHVQLHDAGIRV